MYLFPVRSCWLKSYSGVGYPNCTRAHSLAAGVECVCSEEELLATRRRRAACQPAAEHGRCHAGGVLPPAPGLDAARASLGAHRPHHAYWPGAPALCGGCAAHRLRVATAMLCVQLSHCHGHRAQACDGSPTLLATCGGRQRSRGHPNSGWRHSGAGPARDETELRAGGG